MKKKNWIITVALIINVLFVSSNSYSGLVVQGSTEDEATFLNMLSNMTGGEYDIDDAGTVTAKNTGSGTAAEYINTILTYDNTVKIEVGRNNAFVGIGTNPEYQVIDLNDVEKFGTDATKGLETQDSVLIHEIYERYRMVKDNIGYYDAHPLAIEAENNVLKDKGGNEAGQRIRGERSSNGQGYVDLHFISEGGRYWERAYFNGTEITTIKYVPLNWHEKETWDNWVTGEEGNGVPDGSKDAKIDTDSVHLTNANAQAKNLQVGITGTGSLHHNAWQLTTGTFTLGVNSGSQGTYNLSGTGSLVADAVIVGSAGTGTFSQDTAGSVVVAGDMTIGQLAGGKGSYALKNGELLVGGNLCLGDQAGSAGLLTQEGGTATVKGSLNLGNQGTDNTDPLNPISASQGEYHLNSGSLTVGQASVPADMKVGAAGGGGGFSIGSANGGNPNFTLFGNLLVGDQGAGGVTQDSGTATVTGSLGIGTRGGAGGYDLNNGNLTVGQIGAPVDMKVAASGGAAGFNIGSANGGNPNFTLFGNLLVGDQGAGGVTQDSGTATVTGSLGIGTRGGAGGYDLNNGNLTVGQIGAPVDMKVAASGGAAGFNIGSANGGNPSFTLYGNLFVADQEGSAGGVSQYSGTATITGFINIANKGTGGYSLYNGNLTVGQAGAPVEMRVASTGVGGFSIGSGNGSDNPDFTLYGNLYVGDQAGGLGGVEQYSGTSKIIGSLILGSSSSSKWGTYNLAGGSLQVNSLSVGPQGEFIQSGGTFKTSSVENEGTLTFAQNATIQGDMVNHGEVRINNTTVTFQNYTEYGSYRSDPATTIILGNLTVTPTGFLVGEKGDEWQIGNDFFNTSGKSTDWQTGQAILRFVTGDDEKHQLQIPGLDNGKIASGYVSNFSWGTLDLNGQTLTLSDGSGDDGGALYVGKIMGLTFDDMTVTDIIGLNGLNIYYDLGLNPDLLGLTYNLSGGGYLEPVATPLPGTVWLLLSGLGGIGVLRRMRKPKKS